MVYWNDSQIDILYQRLVYLNKSRKLTFLKIPSLHNECTVFGNKLPIQILEINYSRMFNALRHWQRDNVMCINVAKEQRT